MSRTIIGKPSFESDDSINYLRQLGMILPKGVADVFFNIEVEELPEILSIVERFRDPAHKPWAILTMSNVGVLLYFDWISEVSGRGFDGQVFIPQHRIICIHTVDDERLKIMLGG